MSRTRVRRRRVLATAVVSLAGAMLAGPVGHVLQPRVAAEAAEHRYVVRSGDTLWSIAKRASPGHDPRPLVDAIAGVNHLDPGNLVPGQTIVVPAGVVG